MKRIEIFFASLILGIVFLIGCATAPHENMSAAMSEDHPSFEKLCSKCHTLDRVHAAHQVYSTQQMHELVNRMASKPDSGIDPNAIQDIVRSIY
ncbi:MAG: hypothetical protein GC154_10840 [bacterium]|nr:hypothetical protein [bacterium]